MVEEVIKGRFAFIWMLDVGVPPHLPSSSVGVEHCNDDNVDDEAVGYRASGAESPSELTCELTR